MRVDLHMHSAASSDCRVSPAEMAKRCARYGLGPVFLTDHDSIEGAQELTRAGVACVVGQEVTTTEGELIGLFLKRAIPPGRTPDEAMAAIKEQGGLVYLEHPYDSFRRRLKESAIERLRDQIDIVEVFNARSNAEHNRLAEDLCAILGAAPGAGSDAHRLEDVGAAYVEIEEFVTAPDFLAKLQRARIVRNPNRLRLRVEATLGRLRRR